MFFFFLRRVVTLCRVDRVLVPPTVPTFDALAGVDKVVSGYTGGEVANPDYKEICGGATGHAEAVQITFDPTVISYGEILTVFFSLHDPTTLNRQHNDRGT